MRSSTRKIIFWVFTHSATFVLGGVSIYFALEPASIAWGFFMGSEVHSEASFPRGHMARIYSAWGFGDQQLIFIVDGVRVYRTPDFAPGNVKEEIEWDETGTIVNFKALGRPIYTYDMTTRKGSICSDSGC